jgi:hypothetical protein
MGNWRYWAVGSLVVYYFFVAVLHNTEQKNIEKDESMPATGFHSEVFYNLCQGSYDQLEEMAQTKCMQLGWNTALGKTNGRY